MQQAGARQMSTCQPGCPVPHFGHRRTLLCKTAKRDAFGYPQITALGMLLLQPTNALRLQHDYMTAAAPSCKQPRRACRHALKTRAAVCCARRAASACVPPAARELCPPAASFSVDAASARRITLRICAVPGVSQTGSVFAA